MSALHGVFSWTFVIGWVIGFGSRHLYCRLRARWLDKHHPNPDGTKHRVPTPNRVWLGGLFALAAISYSVYSTQQTADRTDQVISDARTFALQVKECQREFNTAIRFQRRLDQENSDLAAQ